MCSKGIYYMHKNYPQDFALKIIEKLEKNLRICLLLIAFLLVCNFFCALFSGLQYQDNAIHKRSFKHFVILHLFSLIFIEFVYYSFFIQSMIIHNREKTTFCNSYCCLFGTQDIQVLIVSNQSMRFAINYYHSSVRSSLSFLFSLRLQQIFFILLSLYNFPCA